MKLARLLKTRASFHSGSRNEKPGGAGPAAALGTTQTANTRGSEFIPGDRISYYMHEDRAQRSRRFHAKRRVLCRIRKPGRMSGVFASTPNRETRGIRPKTQTKRRTPGPVRVPRTPRVVTSHALCRDHTTVELGSRILETASSVEAGCSSCPEAPIRWAFSDRRPTRARAIRLWYTRQQNERNARRCDRYSAHRGLFYNSAPVRL